MLAIFLKTLPFFALIGTGWLAARLRMFSPEAGAWLSRFVFYFALSAMLFRFAANVDLATLWSWRFVLAWITGSLTVWATVLLVARIQKKPATDAVMEAHTAMSGNTGFLGVPMLVALLGPAAAGPILLVLVVDMVVFTTFVTLLVTALRQGKLRLANLGALARGILSNPMVVSMALGLLWGTRGWAVPAPVDEYLALLGAAATPCALFVIGASLYGRDPARPGPALWLASAKLFLHPAAVAVAALAFGVYARDPFAAGVMICAAALPVAGNVYILAQHYGLAVQRVSTAILFSTLGAIVTLPVAIALIFG